MEIHFLFSVIGGSLDMWDISATKQQFDLDNPETTRYAPQSLKPSRQASPARSPGRRSIPGKQMVKVNMESLKLC